MGENCLNYYHLYDALLLRDYKVKTSNENLLRDHAVNSFIAIDDLSDSEIDRKAAEGVGSREKRPWNIYG